MHHAGTDGSPGAMTNQGPSRRPRLALKPNAPTWCHLFLFAFWGFLTGVKASINRHLWSAVINQVERPAQSISQIPGSGHDLEILYLLAGLGRRPSSTSSLETTAISVLGFSLSFSRLSFLQTAHHRKSSILSQNRAIVTLNKELINCPRRTRALLLTATCVLVQSFHWCCARD